LTLSTVFDENKCSTLHPFVPVLLKKIEKLKKKVLHCMNRISREDFETRSRNHLDFLAQKVLTFSVNPFIFRNI